MQRRRCPRLFAGLLFVAVISPCVFGIAYMAGFGYYLQARAVRTELERIAGVHVDDVWGNEDLTLENIGATIRIGESGVATFRDITPESIREGKHVRLSRIGPYNFFVTDYGELPAGESLPAEMMLGERWTPFLALDPEDDLFIGALFSFELRSVRDVVQHYDEIHSVVSEWPLDPNRKEIQTPDGRAVAISVVMDASNARVVTPNDFDPFNPLPRTSPSESD